MISLQVELGSPTVGIDVEMLPAADIWETFAFRFYDGRAEAAIQPLVWAIEEIAKTGNTEAEHLARLALEALQPPEDEPQRPSRKSPC